MDPITLLVYVLVFMIVLAIIWYASGLMGLPQNIRIFILLLVLLLIFLWFLQRGPGITI